ncbi:MAG: D-alanyl-D-alanine carboxypeptidase/D-alanyl-D-alanine-endopeptidase [Bacteroidales bacterium]|nr:D-alanyl-D-alanine carboxypeptidase/D-alanyl-D-alanine-endopeptidase [Bacteroidales bacterium]
MKKTYIIIISLMLAGIYGASAQSTLAGKAAQLQAAVEGITADPALSEAVMSICARSGDGRTLVDIDGDNMVMPASNMKLISTGAALHALGSDYRFKTGLGHDGKIVDGVLKGNLYIIGGGDPTLGSKDSIATSLDRTFAQWEKIVRDAGIRRIEGMIIGDGRYFEGMPEHPSWLWSDIGTYYGAGATGLMFYENMQSFTASPGQKVGAPVNIAPSYPETPWMEFRYNCATGDKGTGDQLYMYASDLAPVAEIRGTFGVDRARKRVDCSNKFPEYTCASYFADYLKGRGIPSEGPADFRLCTDISGAPAANLTMLGSTSSPSLKRIAFETNHASNNLYAETLFRSIGKAKTGNACYDSSYVALNDVLKELEINVSKGLQIVDGSGLSRQNYVSADFICGFLAAMMESPCFEDYVYSLPSPGSHGTLAYNMQNIPAETKARIKVKSGSMNGVRCYSGYIIPTEGCKEDTIIFSIMVNNCTAPTWKIRPLLDKIMTALAEAN